MFRLNTRRPTTVRHGRRGVAARPRAYRRWRRRREGHANIDVIGGHLTEINVTSPTGPREVDRFGGVSLAADIGDAIERRGGG